VVKITSPLALTKAHQQRLPEGNFSEFPQIKLPRKFLLKIKKNYGTAGQPPRGSLPLGDGASPAQRPVICRRIVPSGQRIGYLRRNASLKEVAYAGTI
jgi:hypothetical protein